MQISMSLQLGALGQIKRELKGEQEVYGFVLIFGRCLQNTWKISTKPFHSRPYRKNQAWIDHGKQDYICRRKKKKNYLFATARVLVD